MNNVEVKFQLDTGSYITIINEKTWVGAIGKPGLRKLTKLLEESLVRNYIFLVNSHGLYFEVGGSKHQGFRAQE